MSGFPSSPTGIIEAGAPAPAETGRGRGQYLYGGTDMVENTTPPLPTKRCARCGEEKPRADFSRNRNYPDGLQYRCKACDATYRAANREKIVAYQATYYAQNRESESARLAAYYLKHREKVLARNAAYRSDHREQQLAYSAAYAAAHREQNAAKARNRRAQIKGNGGTHTAEDVQAQYDRQKGRCYWCDIRVGDDYHVDHVVPISKGGSNGPENLVVTCPPCNRSKNDKHPMDFAGRLL